MSLAGNQWKFFGLLNGLNRDIDVQFPPVEMMLVQKLNVVNC